MARALAFLLMSANFLICITSSSDYFSQRKVSLQRSIRINPFSRLAEVFHSKCLGVPVLLEPNKWPWTQLGVSLPQTQDQKPLLSPLAPRTHASPMKTQLDSSPLGLIFPPTSLLSKRFHWPLAKEPWPPRLSSSLTSITFLEVCSSYIHQRRTRSCLCGPRALLKGPAC